MPRGRANSYAGADADSRTDARADSENAPDTHSKTDDHTYTNPIAKFSDTLWIRLDLTQAEAENEPGSLRLHGSSGGFDQTIAIASKFVPNPGCDTVDAQFDNVPTAYSYSLSYIAADGTETTVVADAPFNSLKDNPMPAEDNGAPAATPEEQS